MTSAVYRDISNGQISGTGSINLSPNPPLFGGVIVDSDGTNAATVVIRTGSQQGPIVLQVVTKTMGLAIFGPFAADSTIYYSITGTAATAQLFGIVPC